MNDELESIKRKMAVACQEVLYNDLTERTEESHGEL
jgi:hypothetical protein